MPSKKSTKTRTRHSTARERSKSAGRATSISRSRTPTRSRSRSRSRVVTKHGHAPASESKIHRRRSPSSSSSSPESVKDLRSSVPQRRQTAPDASGDKRTRGMQANHQANPTRFSQRIVEKADTGRSTTVERHHASCAQSVVPPTISERISMFFQKKICPSSVLAFLCLVTVLPFTYWLNLLVFSPAPADMSDLHFNVYRGIWGPSYRFLGVLWPADWRIYFDYRCHLFVAVYLLLNFILSRFLPLKYSASSCVDSRRPSLHLNGLLEFGFFCGLYAFVQFCKWSSYWIMKPTLLLPKYWFSLLAATGNVATVCALLVHFASKRTARAQPSDGNTSNFFVDLWMGRCLHPRWLGLDWKLVIMRPAATALVLFEITFLLGQWERFGRVSPALCALVVMHFIWVLDYFTFEHTYLHTFDYRHERFGYYLIVGSLLVPFVYSIGACYLSSRPDVGRLFCTDSSLDMFHCVLLGVSIMLFSLGYWIYRAANNQKDLFRRQPNHPSFAELDRISGPHSQRLLAGGWWGFVRHPNYLGDLMMAYAESLPSGLTSPLLWFHPIFLTLFLCHRIWRTECINTAKYGVLMTMYKKLVPKRLIPKVF